MKTLIGKDTCTPLFIAALFIIAKIWEQPKCPSIDKWIKMWCVSLCVCVCVCVCVLEYCSDIKKNEISPFVTIWMGLEDTMLSETGQTEKHRYYMVSFMCCCLVAKLCPILL